MVPRKRIRMGMVPFHMGRMGAHARIHYYRNRRGNARRRKSYNTIYTDIFPIPCSIYSRVHFHLLYTRRKTRMAMGRETHLQEEINPCPPVYL